MATIGLLNLFSRSKTQIKQSVQKKFGGYFSQVIQIPPTMGIADMLRSYGQISWLFACVFKIGQNIADSDWNAYKGDNTTNSLALERLKKPNPFMSKYDLFFKTSGYLDLTGKMFWYLAKDGVGRVKEIWPISPLDMWIIPDKENYIKGYFYRAGVEQIPLEPDEVIFFNYPDFLNPYGGIGPSQAAGNALESDKYAAQWNRNFFYNNAEPQGLLLLPDVNEDDYDRLVAGWNDKYKGVDNAKKTAIIRGSGQVDYKTIQISQKDMDFYNLRQMNRDEILGSFGIHKSILGLTDDVSRANAETAEYTFQKHVIRPRLRFIMEKLNNEYVPMFNEQIELRFTDPVPENKDFIKSVLDSQTDVSITKNESRQIINKLLGEKLDPLPGGDVIYQAISLQPMGTPPPSLPTPDNTQDEPIPPEDNPPEKGKKKELPRQIRKKIARQIEKNNRTRQEDFLKMAEPLEGDFFNAMDSYLKDMQADVAKNIEDGSKDPVDAKKWNKEIQSQTQALYEKCFKTGGKAVADEFKAIGNYIHKSTGVEFDYKDPGVQRAIQKKVSKITQINDDTKQRIKDDIEEMYNSDEGFTIRDIAAKIGSADYAMFDEARAQTIAQTEVLGSLNSATFEGYHQNSDLIDGKYWLATYDNTRQSHLDAAAEYTEDNAIPVDDYFTVGDGEGQYPLDDSLPVEEVVRCHCCMAPKVNAD